MKNVLLVTVCAGLLTFHTSIFSAQKDCHALISILVSSRPTPFKSSRLTAIERSIQEKSLLDIQSALSSSDIRTHNKQIREALKDPVLRSQEGSVLSIDKAKADFLVKLITVHPTNGAKQEKKYDPEECYGFCFGRATLIHSEALRRNTDPEAIKKIWAVGSLEKGRWHFHVATMIKAKGKGSWWVCDPIYKSAESAETWIKRMENSSDDKRMMVFVTDPRRFSVYDPQFYTNIDLLGDGKSDFYNGYFKDYLEYTTKHPKPKPFSP
ncbi:MAG: hypothetical protein EB078_02885 [Proteobacteria bacterium]|nr:hypothetical protein [Pseudomonadota bacterium]NDC23070.1 hypothetical protein [Pseudomonadota bacterium]NDD03829.1 hypothetical protein [Pseudomonadota bacterium]NDG25817.1 hypothetical protein [Pseudomonadota bacterium]